tara:strand:- start:206 stop:1087 length:882 start_codon:yes stop_codon:yes gene_type:complete
MPVPEKLTGLAPAKVNLTLEVGNKRDDGYHSLVSILQTLSLADEVTLTPAASTSIEIVGPFSGGVPADSSNLVWRALDVLAHLLERGGDTFHIRIVKRIPAAGGVGGGASDAATALRLLGRCWPAAEENMIAAAAAAVGSDESFFLTGGTALAEGRGERITPLPSLPRHGVVLFIPPHSLRNKTATVFAAFDRDGRIDAPTVSASLADSLPVNITGADLYNSFEQVAFDCFPGLAQLWEKIVARISEPIRLAGAGPTLFWIGPLDRTEQVYEATSDLDCAVIPTTTAGSLWKP